MSARQGVVYLGEVEVLINLTVRGDSTIDGGETVNGSLGVGTTSPGKKLDVVGDIRASEQLISTKATGTAPLSVVSTTKVGGLNADQVDGYDLDQSVKTDASPTFAKIKLTPEGGYAIQLINKTGAASVKGTIVAANDYREVVVGNDSGTDTVFDADDYTAVRLTGVTTANSENQTTEIGKTRLYYEAIADVFSEWVVDTAYVIGDGVMDPKTDYICILGHTATADDEPGIGVNWETYWVQNSRVTINLYSDSSGVSEFLFAHTTPSATHGETVDIVADNTSDLGGWAIVGDIKKGREFDVTQYIEVGIEESIIPQNTELNALGVVYENSIEDGNVCWVVISGIAECLLKDATTANIGWWAYSADTDGRCEVGLTDETVAGGPGKFACPDETHRKEIGHCLQTKEAGADVLVKVALHFN